MADTTVGQLDLEIVQGAAFSQTFTWVGYNGVPIDLTNYAACLEVRKFKELNTTPLLTFKTGSGSTSGCSITLGGSAGTITIAATPAATALIDWQSAVYDLVMHSDGTTLTGERILEGAITINESVTRNC